MSRRGLPGIGLVVACLVLIPWIAVGQDVEPILDLRIEPDRLTVEQGGIGRLSLMAENRSMREADDLTAYWLAPENLAFAEKPETVKIISPFASGQLDLAIAVPEDAGLGEIQASFEAVYTYCIDEYCYQIVETIELPVTVIEPTPVETPQTSSETVPTVIDPPPPTTGGIPAGTPWTWLLFGAGLVALALALLVVRISGARWPGYVVILVVCLGALVLGVSRSQHEQAQAIGAVLCTSCVGLEESRHDEPAFSQSQEDLLAQLDRDVELVVFYATWCHSCPFAEALVEHAAELNPNIGYRFVDVEVDRSLAEESGVIRSGRTVVPAILRVDTGEVIFGIDRLETRLLDLLGVGA